MARGPIWGSMLTRFERRSVVSDKWSWAAGGQLCGLLGFWDPTKVPRIKVPGYCGVSLVESQGRHTPRK